MDSSLEKNLLVTLLKFQIGLKEVVILFLIFLIKIFQRFCLLEDFGNTKFSDLKNKNLKEQYNLTIKLLVSLAKKPPEFLNDYSRNIFQKELKLFIDWYLL